MYHSAIKQWLEEEKMEINKIPKLLFVGGDRRQIRAANQIAQRGVEVSVFGFGESDSVKFSKKICQDVLFHEIKDKYKIIILPLPSSVDGENINITNEKINIKIRDFFENVSKDSIILAGKCNQEIIKIKEETGFTLIDYFEREDLNILNAIPTAEGAIQIAMEELPFTIHSSKCLVIGNGKIGKILSKMLDGLGADVTVAARKTRDRALAFSFGIKGIPTTTLYENIGNFDIIFNTVPKPLLDKDTLLKVNKNSLVIDLASSPGGIDFDAARKMGIKVIWALSLPGKVAPDTAGDIIGKTIIDILEDLEVE